MFQNIYPVFETKRLLKKEMLENLRDYPRTLFRLKYQEYSDGILTGCDIEGLDTGEAGLRVLPGILLWKGIPYLLEEPETIPCTASGRLAYLKTRFSDKAVGIGQEEYFSKLYLDEEVPDPGRELELARFKLQPGARLRTEYVDFYDYATEFDTADRIHALYSGPGHPTVWLRLLKCFADTLLRLSARNPLDCAFCMSCLQEKEAMPYEAIRTYLNVRLGQDKEYTNQQIYSGLRGILQDAGGREGTPGDTVRRDNTLLMI